MDSDVVVVTHLFRPERASLLELLSALGAEQWQAPTVCPGWSVKDVALHLLGGDIDLLSRRRDGTAPAAAPGPAAGFQELVASLDRLNQTWVAATRRISPRLLCELLAVTEEATERYLTSLEPFAVEETVSWIRPEPVPNWLDVARQYTERWTHHQQIRDAVGVPGLQEPAFLAPVLATFVHALPRAFSDVSAAVGTTVEVVIPGDAGGRWVLTRTPSGWELGTGPASAPRARVALEAETAWRLWTRGIRLRPSPPSRSPVTRPSAFRSWTPSPSSAEHRIPRVIPAAIAHRMTGSRDGPGSSPLPGMDRVEQPGLLSGRPARTDLDPDQRHPDSRLRQDSRLVIAASSDARAPGHAASE